MTDRPILMSAPMVRALLREIEEPGTGKTQTRRLAWRDFTPDIEGRYLRTFHKQEGGCFWKPTIWQSVKPGDWLWVRETWLTGWEADGDDIQYCDAEGNDLPPRIWYRADADLHQWVNDQGQLTDHIPWCPSIHMPRKYSCLTLLVTATKMERVREISRDDAMAEGLFTNGDRVWWDEAGERFGYFATDVYGDLWQSLHTNPGARWADNPEVVALTFRPVLANIDSAGPDARPAGDDQ